MTKNYRLEKNLPLNNSKIDMAKGKVYIGTSGWIYPHWGNGVFYPSELKQGEWFSYYCQHFDTVEINNTFYHLPKREVFENWQRSSPENFVFVVKASRFITHMKKLKDPASSTRNFLTNAAGLGKKIGPILFQLPPFWNLNLERLKEFIDYLSLQKIIPNIRAVFEIRNPTWFCDEVFKILQEGKAALCFADWPDLKIESPVTADFVYLRRHGSTSLYSSEYSQEELSRDAEQIKNWLKDGRDVYIYFNNDAHGWAVKNAKTLKELLSQIRKKPL